jgi:hypothetical protein
MFPPSKIVAVFTKKVQKSELFLFIIKNCGLFCFYIEGYTALIKKSNLEQKKKSEMIDHLALVTGPDFLMRVTRSLISLQW